MNSGVDHEPDRPPHLVSELSELRVRILVQSQLGAEAFGVKSPAFDECRVAAVAAKLGNSLELLRSGDLEMMAGHRLVRGEDFHLPDRPGVELVCVDEELSG